VLISSTKEITSPFETKTFIILRKYKARDHISLCFWDVRT